MQNINIVFSGTGNFGPVQSQVAALNKQFMALNAEMAKSQGMPINPGRYAQATKQVEQMSAAFRTAAASSGMLNVQQFRGITQEARNLDLLQKQKLSLMDLIRRRKILNNVYREQLALQRMTVTQWGTDAQGRLMADMTVPKTVGKDLDTVGNKLGWIRAQTLSASNAMVNWGKNTQWAGRQLMVGFTMPVAVFGAVAGSLAYQADKELTRVAKVYDTYATNVTEKENELALLRERSFELATTAANKYGASIEEVYQVEADLAAAGFRGRALMSSVDQVIKAATLGEIEYATALESHIATRDILNASSKETANIWAYMNSVENATSLAQKDFAEAIPIALGPMKEMSKEGASAGEVMKNLGVLLVGMRAQGIKAGEGANAIKSMMQRLYRPSKQIRQEWQNLAGVNLEKMTANSKDVMELLPKLAAAVKNLPKQDRNKLLGGLFGTYQVQRINAMADALFNGSEQVDRVLEINNQSVAEWRKVQEYELQQWRESAAGQFDIALASMKAALSDMGEPFLKAASWALKIGASFVKWFNSLPSGVKNVAAFLAIIAALVGPIVMLVGLFANFVGTIGRFTGTLMGLITNFRLMNKEQAAAEILARGATTGMIGQAQATAMLTKEVMALTQAQRVAGSTAATTLAAFPGVAGGAAGARGRGGAATTTTAPPLIMGQWTKMDDVMDRMKKNAGDVADEGTKATRSWRGTGAAIGAAGAAAGVLAFTADGAVSNFANMVFMASMLAPALGPVARGMKSIGTNLRGNIGKGVSKVSTATKGWATNVAATAAATAATTKGTHAAATKMGKVKAGASSILGVLLKWGKVLVRVAGPIGLLATGATILWTMFTRSQKVREEQHAINEEVGTYAENLGLVENRWKKIIDLQDQRKAPDTVSSMQRAEKFREENPEIIENLNALGEDQKARNRVVMSHLVEMMMHYDATKKELRKFIEDLSLAQGATYDEAVRRADEVLRSIDLNSIWSRIRTQLRNFGDMVTGALDDVHLDSAKWAGKADILVEQFWSVYQQLDGQARRRYWQNFTGMVNQQWENVYRNARAKNLPLFNKLGMDSMQEFRNALKVGRTEGMEGLEKLFPNVDPLMLRTFFAIFMQGTTKVGRQAQNLHTIEQQIIKALEEQGLKLKGIKSLGEAGSRMYKDQNMTVREGAAAWKAYQKNVEQGMGKISKESQLQYLNGLRVQMGYEKTTRLSDGLKENIEDTTKGTKKHGDEVDKTTEKIKEQERVTNRLADAWNSMDVKSKYQQAIQDTQQDIADRITERFEARQEAAMDALEERGEQRMAAFERNRERQERIMDRRQQQMEDRHARQSQQLEDQQQRETQNLEDKHEAEQYQMETRHEREMARFDSRWKARTDTVTEHYDKRIARINRAIDAEERADEIRQRIFDAEMTRIQRLAEMANMQIDFSVALNTGDLDEAARIRNDAMAQGETWSLEDAGERAGRRSEAKRDRLGRRIERFEKERDARLEALQEMEDAHRRRLEREQRREQRHLELTQRRQQRALEKQQRMEQRALEKSQRRQQRAFERERERWNRQQDRRQELLQDEIDAERDAAEKIWETRRNKMDKAIEKFLQFIPRNERELRKHVKRVLGEYTDFGKDVKKKGDDWGKFIGNALERNVKEAGRAIKNEMDWAAIGKRAATRMIGGAFGMSIKEFKKWVGVPGLDSEGGGGNNGGGNNGQRFPGNDRDLPGRPTRHAGGWVGSGGKDSRRGFPANARPFQNETNVLAKSGEFVVNDKVAGANARQLERLNKTGVWHDRHVPKQLPYGAQGRGAGRRNVGGLGVGLLGLGLKTIVAAAMRHGIQKKGREQQMEDMAGGGQYKRGKAGKYGGRFFGREQMRNAAIIASVGSRMHMSPRDIMIGIMTAITESGLVNVHHGDRDSLGLFQQRPSQGWGTPKQVTDPEYASKKFFKALKTIRKRDSMRPWLAAQAVQRSGTSDGSNYKPYWDDAKGIFKAMKFIPGMDGGKINFVPKGNKYKGLGVKPWVDEAAEYIGKLFNLKPGDIGGYRSSGSVPGSDHPKGLALDFMTYGNKKKGSAIAKELMQLRKILDLTYIIWNRRITSKSHGWNWRRYTGPSPHTDHVHASFEKGGRVNGLLGRRGSPGVGDGPRNAPRRAGRKHRPIARGLPLSRGGAIHDAYTGFPSLDIAAGVGHNVYAVRNGRVYVKENTGNDSYGKYLKINHIGMNQNSLYAHLKGWRVREGQFVRSGQVIAKSGNSGGSTGPHLHFGIEGGGGPRNYYPSLNKGGTMRWDSPIMAHQGERVLTADLTRELDEGIRKLNSGGMGGNMYVSIDVLDPNVDTKAVARDVMMEIRKEEKRVGIRRNNR